MTIQPLSIDIPGEELVFLKKRLRQTLLPSSLCATDWHLGIKADYFTKVISYWSTDYNWKKEEDKLNQFNHFRTAINDFEIHFIYERGESKNSIPLLLTHGWPDSFLRYTKVVSLLTKKRKLNVSQEFSFDVIIPSLPGFGFSNYPKVEQSINNKTIANLWHELMTKELGFSKYIAAGGDLGSGISRYLAVNFPADLLGIYLNDVGLIRELLTPKNKQLTQAEHDYQDKTLKWMDKETGYINIQATKPQTLSFALADSPAGMAAWILEKFYTWSGNDTQLELDDVLTNIMIYWISNSISTANRIYYENSHFLPAIDKIAVPTGMGIFPEDLVLPPKDWVKSHFNLIHWTEISKGGHFTAWENPQEYADDLAEFAQKLL
ncbi:epoxide hydrolase family protein [Liquorilactobacillus oeni]|uniref:Epoxide hydrolase N-terminal domain-containing protein n=1 Tax=Liquorilactobacillus oeni DSM 19972 TaxID=1423777 RepID=A0A0R1MGX6_9LACO|nr:epoxide hydrolase family protein [Liquorilactobacillus oeni]KRL04450.1 hypothetical protein FD46_GL001579 [Liquorilactobacillus oeni DSM 19972]